MAEPFIEYREGNFKYELAAEHVAELPEFPEGVTASLATFAELEGGVLTIRKGYAWDGASGPVVDRPSNMRASLVHDALYQLMRAGLLDRDFQSAADEAYVRLCVEDGTWRWWARTKLWGLSKFGRGSTLGARRRPVLRAP